MAKLRIGVVGCGYWGPNLIRNFRALPGCELRKVCDISQDRLNHIKSVYPEVELETDFQRMVEDPQLDALAIATSARLHFPMAKASLLAGKHTLVEKPLGISSEECRELTRLAAQQDRILMVGHTYLFSPAVRKIKEIIDSGDIGELRYIAARRLNLGLFQKDINTTWDLAPHDISIILHLIGDLPLSVNCQGSAHITPGIEDVTVLSIHFEHKCSAFIHNSWLDPRKVREMTIVGSRKMIVYDDVASREKIKIFDARVDRPPHYDTFAEFHYAYHYGDVHIPYIKQEEPLKNECQHFLDCIASGNKPLASGTEGLAVVQILEAASKSLSQSGASITLSA